MSRQTIIAQLQCSAEQESALAKLVAQAQDAFVSVCMREGAKGEPAPLRFLAKYWNDHPSYGRDLLESSFAHYLASIEPGPGGRSYQELIGETCAGLASQVREVLQAETGTGMEPIGVREFIRAFAGGDPLGLRLAELMAGLPPLHDTAVTDVGLPVPEDHRGKFAGLFCPMPFEFAQVDPLGQLYLCCPQQLPEAVGNLASDDFMSVWNSETAQEVRKSILDGSFRYCSEKNCGALQSRNLPQAHAVKSPQLRQAIDTGKVVLDHGPKEINMSYDRSCNLACPSCRTSMIVLKGKARDRAEVIHERVTAAHLKDAKRLTITGSGDPFGSKLFHRFLREFDPASAPGLKITLSTNGLLFTPLTWAGICQDAIDRVDLSVDGASQATYALNRGGDFAKLVKNLEFIGLLRTSGKLKTYELHYVVQENNFHEMKDFVELGLRVNCDVVCFKRIVNWGTYSEEDYISRAIQSPSHPRHAELLSCFQDPIFDHPKVYMHDMQGLFRASRKLNPGESLTQ